MEGRKKVVFYGDSNTYGYDPRDFLGGRYPEEILWTTRVAENLEKKEPGHWDIVNQGMNGRRIPYSQQDYRFVDLLLRGMQTTDIFAIMLGTNDILLTMMSDADLALERMERFLSWFSRKDAPPELLLLAPPFCDPQEAGDPAFDSFAVETAAMNNGFARLAEQYDVRFTDTSPWGIEFAYDMVHFSEKGHEIFAEHMTRLLEAW